MNVPALITVGVLALVGLVAAMVQYAAHLNGPQRPARPAPAGRHSADVQHVPPERRVWLAEPVVDPLTEAELALGRLDHGAESFAVNTGIFRTDHERQREEFARTVWNAGFDWYLDKLNRQFDDLLADLPTTDQDPFDPAYWPVVSAVPTSGLPGAAGPPVDLDRLAAFSPEATIRIIEQRNAAPTVFSWTTREQPLLRGHGDVQVAQSGGVTLVRERVAASRWHVRRAARHRR